jgi:hypothetical protein
VQPLRILLAAISLLLVGCELFNPLEGDQEEAGVEITVVACARDETSGVATATFELTSEKEYDTILVQGELSDSTGVVIATSSTSVVGVRPGRTYRQDIVFGSPSEPEGELSCAVHFDFASAGLPD